jgi:hypothetical protein
MGIRVQYDYKLLVHPDPARVTVGEPVEWVFLTSGTGTLDTLVWTVYFDHGSPFGILTNRFTVATLKTAIVLPQTTNHIGLVGAVYAALPGDYKYGVRLQDPHSGAILGDDDPRLIVT